MSSTKQIGFFEGLDLFIDCKNVSYIYISAGTYHCSQVIAGGSIPKGMCNMASCVCRGDLIICGGETIRLVWETLSASSYLYGQGSICPEMEIIQ